VYVVEKRWEPWRPPHAVSAPRLAANLSLLARAEQPRVAIEPADEGMDLDSERLHDFQVALRSGREADDRVFVAERPTRQAGPGCAVTFAIDLSVSLEIPRAANSDALPIVLGLEAVQGLAATCERSQIATAVFGVHDIGRRPVTFHCVKDFADRLDLARIGGLHSIGIGGCRLGAVIRHTAARMARDFPKRNLLVLVTDSASHYFAVGMDSRLRSEFVTKRCRNCQARARCPVEVIDPRTTIRESGPDSPNFFYPTFYEFADIRDAKNSNPALEVFAILLGSHYSQRSLDKTFGPRNWATVLSRSDISGLPRAVWRLLQKSDRAYARRSL
jgi:hypothetical protein